MKLAPFDTPSTIRFNEARKVLLERLLPTIVKQCDINTALDVGCGFGFFSRSLKEFGLQVTAVDGRAENVTEAQKRIPDVEFKVHDAESPSILSIGRFDLVLCFGLLYHLENPFLVVRHLAELTGKVLLIETVIVSSKSLSAVLYEEDPRQDQGLNYIALIPTESWFVKCLYIVGFPFVYKMNVLPDHEYYRSSLIKKRKRTVLIASKVELSSPLLCLVSEPRTNRHMWDTFGIGFILKSEPIRKILKSGRRLFNSSYHFEE